MPQCTEKTIGPTKITASASPLWNGKCGERIATLERQMQDLMGNGQPGRIREIENAVNAHQKLIWIGTGILFAGQILLVLLHFFSPVVAKLPINP